MLALFLAIALLGTNGAYGRSIIDLTGVNHDDTDLGGSELHAKAGAYYGGDYHIDFTGDNLSRDDLPALTDDDFANAIDSTGAKLEVDILSDSLVPANNIIGLAPPRPPWYYGSYIDYGEVDFTEPGPFGAITGLTESPPSPPTPSPSPPTPSLSPDSPPPDSPLKPTADLATDLTASTPHGPLSIRDY